MPGRPEPAEAVELLFVNDGSTDATLAAFTAVQEYDLRLVITGLSL